MAGTKKSTWIGGTVVLAVAIMALAWFLLIAPVIDETVTAASDTQVAEDRNTALTTQLDRLKEQFAELDSYKADLATIEGQIPATGRTSDFVRTISTLADAAGTTIVDLSVETPLAVAPAVPVAPAAEATTDPAAEGAEATEAPVDGSAATATGPTPIPGFVAIPVTVKALGNPVGVLNFLGALQQQSDRLFLVTALDGSGQDAADASGGRPATADGDLELSITGYIYVLQDAATVAPEDDASGEAPTPPSVGDGSGAFANT
jgi:hypothetical protein